MIIKEGYREKCPTCGQHYGCPIPAILGCDTCRIELGENKVIVYFVAVDAPLNEYGRMIESSLEFCSHRCMFEYLNAHPFVEFALDSYIRVTDYEDFVAAAAGEGEQP